METILAGKFVALDAIDGRLTMSYMANRESTPCELIMAGRTVRICWSEAPFKTAKYT